MTVLGMTVCCLNQIRHLAFQEIKAMQFQRHLTAKINHQQIYFVKVLLYFSVHNTLKSQAATNHRKHNLHG